jgi:hypothetical protein
MTATEWFITFTLGLFTRYVAYGSDTATKCLLMSLSLIQPLWIRDLTYTTPEIASLSINRAEKWTHTRNRSNAVP